MYCKTVHATGAATMALAAGVTGTTHINPLGPVIAAATLLLVGAAIGRGLPTRLFRKGTK